MIPNRSLIAVALAALLGLSVTRGASAASLQQVSNWGVSGLPSDVSMSIYVPDNVRANPPIVALIHYCGGTASAVFGQAQGGGLVRAADQYGFIMVVPSSGRCWDVVSNKTRTRDGLGDSHAIRQMVKYAVETRNGNAERVYATGDSSGGMMTELLLALYPDVFKAGSAMAGMPAGCRGANESGTGGGYSGACAGGSVTHTAQEWGDTARMLAPGFMGHRARVQLFHGDADTTIRFANHTEAIKQWTNVLGLGTNPTSTSTVTLGTHQATRETWQNACGHPVLDAFTSRGGDHGPSDALFLSQYIVPFLGLDDTGAVDPEIARCGMGMGGAGGAGGAAGAAGAGGRSAGGAGGAGAMAGANGGGFAGAGFAGGSNAGMAGNPSVGGSGAAGGVPTMNGGQPGGGATSVGSAGAGGALGTGGSSVGVGGVAGGASGQGTSGDSSGVEPESAEPSGCTLVGAKSKAPGGAVIASLALGLLLGRWSRRQRIRR